MHIKDGMLVAEYDESENLRYLLRATDEKSFSYGNTDIKLLKSGGITATFTIKEETTILNVFAGPCGTCLEVLPARGPSITYRAGNIGIPASDEESCFCLTRTDDENIAVIMIGMERVIASYGIVSSRGEEASRAVFINKKLAIELGGDTTMTVKWHDTILAKINYGNATIFPAYDVGLRMFRCGAIIVESHDD